MHAAFAELTVTARRTDGTAGWLLAVDSDEQPSSVDLAPAVAFLAARGGGLMVLPLND